MGPNLEKHSSVERQDNETLVSSANSYAEVHDEKRAHELHASVPDIDHEETERMDALHEEDLEKGQQVRNTTHITHFSCIFNFMFKLLMTFIAHRTHQDKQQGRTA